MAYCEKCGAYIPDGQTKCLACGYDPDAQAAYQAAAAAREQEDEARRAEERRRQRQEEYRQRAVAEFARRQKATQEQERQTEARAAGHPYSESGRVQHYDYGYDAGYDDTPHRGQVKQNKLLAAASYLGILCILPYIFCPDDRFARFHAKQGLVLLLFDVLTSVLGGLTGIGWLLSLFSVYCVFKGFFGALGGRMEELPLIGKLANRIG